MAVTKDELIIKETQADDAQNAQAPQAPAGAGESGMISATNLGQKDNTQGVETPGQAEASQEVEVQVGPEETATLQRGAPAQEEAEENDGEDVEAATYPEMGRGLSYVQMYQQMNPYTPPTKEELEKERKKQKREAIFSAIGDGISALSNLYFTSQYAPDAYDASKGLSATAKTRFDKLKKDHEDNMRQYMQGYMQAMKMDSDAAKEDRNWRHTLERERITDQYKAAAEARADAKAARDAAMSELKMELMLGKIDEQGYRTELAKIKADYEEELKKSQINKNNSPKTGGGGRGATPKYPVFDENGDVVKYVYTKDEGVSETERLGGTYPGQTKTQNKSQQKGRKKESSTSTTKTAPTAGRTPRPKDSGAGNKEDKKKKANPMGNSSGSPGNNGGKKKKANPMTKS